MFRGFISLIGEGLIVAKIVLEPQSPDGTVFIGDVTHGLWVVVAVDGECALAIGDVLVVRSQRVFALSDSTNLSNAGIPPHSVRVRPLRPGEKLVCVE